jgi:hypothetical protein
VSPTLVPIHGGLDSGMDGAMADGEGGAYPLVATTAKNVIGNLTRSLDSYLDRGGTRRRLVVATSTALSPKKRWNLEERAREKGFVLLQIHERRDIADALGVVGGDQVRRLELLTRAQIVEVLRSLGIQAPEDDRYLQVLAHGNAFSHNTFRIQAAL